MISQKKWIGHALRIGIVVAGLFPAARTAVAVCPPAESAPTCSCNAVSLGPPTTVDCCHHTAAGDFDATVTEQSFSYCEPSIIMTLPVTICGGAGCGAKNPPVGFYLTVSLPVDSINSCNS
jgi:hypothetical protein